MMPGLGTMSHAPWQSQMRAVFAWRCRHALPSRGCMLHSQAWHPAAKDPFAADLGSALPC